LQKNICVFHGVHASIFVRSNAVNKNFRRCVVLRGLYWARCCIKCMRYSILWRISKVGNITIHGRSGGSAQDDHFAVLASLPQKSSYSQRITVHFWGQAYAVHGVEARMIRRTNAVCAHHEMPHITLSVPHFFLVSLFELLQDFNAAGEPFFVDCVREG
jgi:hypothetical protein